MKLPPALADLPLSVKEGWNTGAGFEAKKVRGFSHVVFIAHGASKPTVHLVVNLLKNSTIPVTVLDSPELPAFIGSSTLVILVSALGDSDETFHAANEAFKKNAKLVFVTSGGKLMRFSEEKHCQLVRLPVVGSSLEAFPFVFFSLLAICQKLGLNDSFSDQLLQIVDACSQQWDKKGAGIAEALLGMKPFILATPHYAAVADFWRFWLANVAKLPAVSSSLSEFTGEHLCSFEVPEEQLRVILIRDEFEQPEARKKAQAAKQFLQARNIKVLELVMKGQSIVTKVVTAAVVGISTSYILADQKGINPTDRGVHKQFSDILKKVM